MRVLVDHSGYDVRNLGDAAMLATCVSRLQSALPGASIDVVSTAPARLSVCCPGTTPVRSSLVDTRALRLLPASRRLAAEQVWKIVGPYLLGRIPQGRGEAGSVLHAIRDADLVVAAGGGYLTDDWWWHAGGVLSVLAAAQRLGRPTAMFGQGLGPLTNRMVRRQASAVFPRLDALGVREGLLGPRLATELGVRPDRLAVTGDDALELAVAVADPGAVRPDVLGVNVRLAGYTNLDRAAVLGLARTVRTFAVERGIRLQALPVSGYSDSSDVDGIRALLAGFPADLTSLQEFSTPTELARAAASCRAIVTATYHAAAFALAAGVPAVCLSRSGYYDVKFRGLAGLFPGAATLVSLDAPDAQHQVRAALERAWEIDPASRAAARASAAAQVRASRALYARFLSPWTPTASSQHQQVPA